jgi:polyisoprenoid-binding protein YceI
MKTRALTRLLSAIVWLSVAAAAQQVQFTLDPAQTQIQWTLEATMHTVHGTFKLKSGQLSFDPRSGIANGEIVVDATSGESGNHARDSKMHKDVLDSKRYPEISFFPKKVLGRLSDQGSSSMQVQGLLHIHGADHDITLTIPIEVTGNQMKASTNAVIPYKNWGMKNPSNLFLHVDDEVQLSIVTTGRLTHGSKVAASE